MNQNNLGNNLFDNSPGMRYNNNNELYEQVVDSILSKPTIVKMDEQKAINDSKHEHQLVADLEDKLGTAIYHGCIVPRCGVGFYIQPAKE